MNQNQSPSNVVPLNTGPDWKALADMYGKGAMDVEIAKELGITIGQFYEMEADLAEFADFVAKGRTMSQAWWVKTARENLFNKDLNAGLFAFNMKNRFGWADKIDTKDTTDDVPNDADGLRAGLVRAAKKLGKKHPELLKELGNLSESD